MTGSLTRQAAGAAAGCDRIRQIRRHRLCAIYGLGLIPDIEEAIAAGIEVVVLNQIVGADLTTSDPQVDGIAASVLASPYRSGVRHGTLTVQSL